MTHSSGLRSTMARRRSQPLPDLEICTTAQRCRPRRQERRITPRAMRKHRVQKTMCHVRRAAPATPANFQPTSQPGRPAPGMRRRIRNISNSSRSWRTSRIRNIKNCSRSRIRSISDWLSRTPMMQGSSRWSKNINNKRSSWSKNIHSNSSTCSKGSSQRAAISLGSRAVSYGGLSSSSETQPKFLWAS